MVLVLDSYNTLNNRNIQLFDLKKYQNTINYLFNKIKTLDPLIDLLMYVLTEKKYKLFRDFYLLVKQQNLLSSAVSIIWKNPFDSKMRTRE